MVKIGIIGTGIIAKEHAKSIATLPGEATLVAAADSDPNRLAEFSDIFHVDRKYADAMDLIADPNVELVVVATPPAAHEVFAVVALDAGKYVLCEKPLAHSLASAMRIAEAAARHPGRLAAGYQLRYERAFRRLLWICQNGWIGDIQSALVERHSYIPHSDFGRGGWWGVWNVAGGGVLMTQMIHELDLMLLVMGRPLSVTATMDTRFTNVESEDFVEAKVQFEGGRTARCIGSVNSGYLGGGLAFRGSKGTIGLPWQFSTQDPVVADRALKELDRALPDARIPSSSMAARIGRLLAPRLGIKVPPELAERANLYREIVSNIRAGSALPIPADEALASLELCAAIYESALAGKEVTIPLGVGQGVYDGVTKEEYAARKCKPNKTWAVEREMSLGGVSAPKKKRGAEALIREALAVANIEPAIIKAMLRKPQTVHGGPRTRRTPWPRRRLYDQREMQAVKRLMNREIRFGGAIIYGGPEERAYCEAFANYLGGGYADAVNSGTNAVYVALRALGIEPGSEVIVPPATDAGGTMPVALSMCIPVPADSAPGSLLTTVEQITTVLSERTAAIVIAHIAGHAVDIDPILELAAKRGIPVIEDCAQAHGTLYKNRLVGTFGAIAAFSSMFGKQHATGAQGGVVFTKDPILFGRAKAIADRGKSIDASGNQHNVVASLNFNQDELSMAIGRVQLEKLPGVIRARRVFASLVEDGLRGTDSVLLLGDTQHCKTSYFFLLLKLDTEKLHCTSQEFASALEAEGIGGVYGGYPVYPTDQAWHRDAAVFGTSGMPWSLHQQKPRHFELPNAHQANLSLVRLDVHESLGRGEAQDLVAAIRKVARYFSLVAEQA